MSKEIITLRLMAWERAKGELRSFLQTYWPDYSSDGKTNDNGFDKVKVEIDCFIQYMEDNCM